MKTRALNENYRPSGKRLKGLLSVLSISLTVVLFAAEGVSRPASKEPPTSPKNLANSQSKEDSKAKKKSPTTILILGDSLTEGYGVAKQKAYPAILEKVLNAEREKSVKVINSGISGSTTASALSRLKWSLRSPPDWLIIALGANDGLRGFDVKATEKNLREAITFAQSKNVKVILAGMMMPPNYGKKYQEDFRQLFPSLAKELKIPLLPFLLVGVGGEADKNLPDGIHPNEEGHRIIANTVKDFLVKYL